MTITTRIKKPNSPIIILTGIFFAFISMISLCMGIFGSVIGVAELVPQVLFVGLLPGPFLIIGIMTIVLSFIALFMCFALWLRWSMAYWGTIILSGLYAGVTIAGALLTGFSIPSLIFAAICILILVTFLRNQSVKQSLVGYDVTVPTPIALPAPDSPQ